MDMAMVPARGGKLSIENMTLRYLIRLAYRVREFQVQGGPAWTGSARVDIAAKAESDVPFSSLGPMLQTLLEERFQLAMHRETREVQVLVLVGAKGGMKVPEAAEVGCDRIGALDCGTIRMTRGQLDGSRVSMDSLVRALSDVLGSVVVDETGFNGECDVHLRWRPEEMAGEDEGSEASVVTVLRERLGLRVESRKMPIEVLVIDRAVWPSSN